MCVVSMITEHYWRQYPNPVYYPRDKYRDMEELIRKAREYDRIMNQPDCPDPVKADWYKQVIEKMNKPQTWTATSVFFDGRDVNGVI